MRRALLVGAIAVALVALAWPDAHAENLGSDPFGELTGGDGLRGRYPLSAYALDTHIDTSLNPASWGEEAIGMMTTVLWTITRLINALTFWLVDTAFNLDLLSADGPLEPIARAMRSVNEHVLGEPWMIAMIALTGLWLIKKAIVERKHAEAASSLALSALLIVAVMFVLFRPIQTVGQVASWTNDVSEAMLVGTNTGSLANRGEAKRRIMDNVVRAVQVEPWAQLNFGGLRHCVDGTRRNKDGYPTPVDCDDPRRTAERDHMKVVGGVGGYAPRFLKLPPGSRARNMEYEALKNGEVPTDPFTGSQFQGYHVDKSDSPAVDIQQSGAADSRLGMAAVILLVSAMFATLFGGLAVLIMLVQVGALLVVALSPVALLAAVMPGPGHALVIAWGKKLLTLLVVKAFFALVMSMLIVIHMSLSPSTSGMGWLPMYALIGLFYFLVIWKHKWVGEKMQVASRRDTSTVERTVRERTVQAGALVAAPLATTWGMMRDKQESALGSEKQEPQAAGSASSGPPTGATPSSERGPRPTSSVTLPETASSAASTRPSAVPSASSADNGGGPVTPAAPGTRGPASLAAPPASPEPPPSRPPAPLDDPELRDVMPVENPMPTQRQEEAPTVPDLAPPPEYRGPS